MNILMLCTKFSLNENDPWLSNELADAFANQKAQVHVVTIDWARPYGAIDDEKTFPSGVKAVVLSPVAIQGFGSFVEKASKWIVSSMRAVRVVRNLQRIQKFDLTVGYSPAVTMALPLLVMSKLTKSKMYLIQWDFFPFHHQQIGLIKSRLIFKIAKFIENKLMRLFNHIGCMTLMNVDYLKSHYDLKPEQKVHLLPVWGSDQPIKLKSRDEVRRQLGLFPDAKLAVFGGQITHGRGIEQILSVAKIAHRNGDDFYIVFIGSGELEYLVRDAISDGLNNVILINRIVRDEYLSFVSGFDVAIVCTATGVDVPTFPSKTIDYFRLKLPIVASVESTTDYGSFIFNNKIGLSSIVGNDDDFYQNLKLAMNNAELRQTWAENGYLYFCENMKVGIVANKIFADIMSGRRG
ncbi:glycosyltransferase family 4 protein [Chitinibacter tainanensis]|uniref:glycosyltransferase family 4 protein n=1 Tax=Chitinibacter tainanensis TaxID=230667 RepID=UPI000406A616|nr:glycosyltransferase family 4 protein [Chitinibacter tainanensis]